MDYRAIAGVTRIQSESDGYPHITHLRGKLRLGNTSED